MTKHPKDAHTRFHEESLTFIQASTYLMTVHIAAAKDAHLFSSEHNELAKRLAPTYADPHQYFMASLFVAHIAAFEFYLQELVTSVVLRHPKKVGGVQFKLSDVLDAEGSEPLVQRAIDELLNKLLYKKPLEYRDELADLLSIDKTIIEKDWPTFIEAKARRDLGTHADWKCNTTYLRKVAEAGLTPTFQVGESVVPEWNPYARRVSDVLYQLTNTLTSAVVEKHWKSNGRSSANA